MYQTWYRTVLPKKVLITGGCGFLGSNLAKHLIKSDHKVCILSKPKRMGSFKNLEWLRQFGDFELNIVDIADREAVHKSVSNFKPDAVFHLAGQVAVTVSQNNPARDFDINALGTVNLLEAVRFTNPEAPFIFASTNKVYGDLDWVITEEGETRYAAPAFPEGFSEALPIDLKTPYGCSKGAADMYVLEYSRGYGLNGACLRHSSMFGPRQFATADQGWIGWFIAQSGNVKICGNGKQVRDVLYVDDVVDCYMKVLGSIDRARGNAYNIGGGMKNSLSILELLKIIEEEKGERIMIEHGPNRPSDQRIFVSDNSKALRDFGWSPKTSKIEGIRKMIDWSCCAVS
jgi:CDP-paratose 2-epimerase